MGYGWTDISSKCTRCTDYLKIYYNEALGLVWGSTYSQYFRVSNGTVLCTFPDNFTINYSLGHWEGYMTSEGKDHVMRDLLTSTRSMTIASNISADHTIQIVKFLLFVSVS